jgi:hypothetical protein
VGGILPFGLGVGVSAGGDIHCLSANSEGQAEPPCDATPGPGTFGPINAKLFGNPEIPTSPSCNLGSNDSRVVSNIRFGLDHLVVPAESASSPVVPDDCYNVGVNALYTLAAQGTGFPGNAVEHGLIRNGSYAGVPRLAQSDEDDLISVFGRGSANNVPLWEYLNAAAKTRKAVDLAWSCDPADWSIDEINHRGDDFDDEPHWKDMLACLRNYSSDWGVIFDEDLADNPRFAYVPQFWDELSPVSEPSSQAHRIKQFRAIFIQSMQWGTGAATGSKRIFSPGEPCITADGGTCEYSQATNNLRQVTSFLLPSAALPESVRGTSGTGGGLNPFTVTLFR